MTANRTEIAMEHGVVTVPVPWMEPNSGFTPLFEALVIDWLKEASASVVSRQMGLHRNAIDLPMQPAITLSAWVFILRAWSGECYLLDQGKSHF